VKSLSELAQEKEELCLRLNTIEEEISTISYRMKSEVEKVILDLGYKCSVMPGTICLGGISLVMVNNNSKGGQYRFYHNFEFNDDPIECMGPESLAVDLANCLINLACLNKFSKGKDNG
jgi:hypothetical protein